MHRGKLINRICEGCTKPFKALKFKVNAGKGKYCSGDCYFQTRRNLKRNEVENRAADVLYQKKTKYGLTPERYRNLFVLQDNKCVICFRDFSETKAFVDHCHSTGKVRGLLCTKCNSLLGFANDNVEILKRAIEYLRV